MSEENASRVLWFVAGAAVGASIALLFAPASGFETRRRISQKTHEGRDALVGSSKELWDRGRDLYEQGRKMADEAAELFDRGRKLVHGQA